ncbi:MAG: hypothetical protein ACTSQ8_22275 [Candidatus Helarchaeota archaeon]
MKIFIQKNSTLKWSADFAPEKSAAHFTGQAQISQIVRAKIIPGGGDLPEAGKIGLH